jgi:hypothetical protein
MHADTQQLPAHSCTIPAADAVAPDGSIVEAIRPGPLERPNLSIPHSNTLTQKLLHFCKLPLTANRIGPDFNVNREAGRLAVGLLVNRSRM